MYNGRITLGLRSDEHCVNGDDELLSGAEWVYWGKVREDSTADHGRDSDQRASGAASLASSRSFIWHWPRELCVAIAEWHGVGPRSRLSQKPGDSYTSGSALFLATGVARPQANPTRPDHPHLKSRCAENSGEFPAGSKNSSSGRSVLTQWRLSLLLCGERQ